MIFETLADYMFAEAISITRAVNEEEPLDANTTEYLAKLLQYKLDVLNGNINRNDEIQTYEELKHHHKTYFK